MKKSGAGRPAPSATLRILNTEPQRFSERARDALRGLGDVTEVEADRAYLLSNVSRYNVLFVALRNTIDRQIIDRSDRLRCIVTPTTGTNHVDVEAAREKGIELLSLHGETAFLQGITATAELAWGLLLALIRRIPGAHASVRQGQWQRDRFCGTELQNKTLGILGYGRLGKMVASYGRAFRMSVVAFDHKEIRPAPDGIEVLTLSELLRRSDVVSIHLPLTAETERLFDHRQFAAMKDGAVLINTSRGAIVDEDALLDALTRGKLAGVALDVMADESSLSPEWLTDSRLAAYCRAHENLLITPHIGGVTYESVEKANLFMIRKLAAFLQTHTSAPVPPFTES